jgi:hypothetical protein
MKLWGKIASGMLLAIAALSTAAAGFMPETRPESLLAAVLTFVVAWFGVPAFVRFFSSFTGDEEVLANGIPGVATVTSVRPTRWRVNGCPIVGFSLSVEAGGAVYPVEVKQMVDPELAERISPGVTVGVRVGKEEPKKVFIDWREPIQGAAELSGGGLAQPKVGETPSAPARRTRSRQPFLRWAFLIFGLVFLRLSCEQGYFEKGGLRAQGVVMEKTYSPGTRSTSPGRHQSSSKHYVSYRFTTEDGRTIEGRYEVLPDTWRRLKEGDKVVIEYLPDSPTTNRIPEQRAESGTWRIMALVSLMASAVLFLIGKRRRQAAT